MHLLDLPIECAQHIIGFCDTDTKLAFHDTSQSTRRLVEMSLPKLNSASRTVSPYLFTIFLERSGLTARLPFWSCYAAKRIRNKQQTFSVRRSLLLFPRKTPWITIYPRRATNYCTPDLNVTIIVTDKYTMFLSQSQVNRRRPHYIEPVYTSQLFSRPPLRRFNDYEIVEKRMMLIDRSTYQTKAINYIVQSHMCRDEYWLPFKTIFDLTVPIHDDECFDSLGVHLGDMGDLYEGMETIQSVEILKIKEWAMCYPNKQLQKMEEQKEQVYCTLRANCN